MALGYQARREAPPVQVHGVCLYQGAASFKAAIDGMLNTVSLPTSQVEFEPDGTECPRTKKPRGTFEIPRWLAKKEGIV